MIVDDTRKQNNKQRKNRRKYNFRIYKITKDDRRKSEGDTG